MSDPQSQATPPALTVQFVPLPVRQDVLTHLVVNCVVGFLMLVIVSLRVAARIVMGAGLGWDDGLILFAMPFAVALIVEQGYFSQLGSGYPLPEAMMNLPLILRISTSFQLIYVVALTSIKASILCFYHRVFKTEWMAKATKITFAVVIAWGLSIFFGIVFICSPVKAQWDLNVTDGHCGDQIKLFKGMIATNIITDVAIMFLPIYTVLHLQMRFLDKLGIIACFLIGIAVIVAAFFRLAYISSVDMVSNLTGTMPVSVFLSAFEPNLSMICASLPMLRPFYSRYRAQNSSAKLSEGSDRFGSGMKNSHPSGGHSKNSGRNKMGINDPTLITMDDLTPDANEHRFEVLADGVSHRTEGSIDDSGSERKLTSAGKGIRVHKKWNVDVDGEKK